MIETRLVHDMHGYSFEWRESGLHWWQILFGYRNWMWVNGCWPYPELWMAKQAAIDFKAKMNIPRRILQEPC